MHSSQVLTTDETDKGFEVILTRAIHDTKLNGLFFCGKRVFTEKGRAIAHLRQHEQCRVTFEASDQDLPDVDEHMVEVTPEGYRAVWISVEHENQGYLLAFIRNCPSDIFGHGHNPEQLLEDLHKWAEKRMQTSTTTTMRRSNTPASTGTTMDAIMDVAKDTTAPADNGTVSAGREGEVRLIAQIAQLLHGGLFGSSATSRSASPSSQPCPTTSSCTTSLLSPPSPPSSRGIGEVVNDSSIIQFDDSDKQSAMSPSLSGTSITMSSSRTGGPASQVKGLSLEGLMSEPFLKQRRGWTSKS
ncbi:hypothetical protein BT69DRAFT_1285768 [Atractiella rhizophila]|nr:hypothetical protein BT69DRAFT_1285768 [Atractiella rhizophila]